MYVCQQGGDILAGKYDNMLMLQLVHQGQPTETLKTVCESCDAGEAAL